MIHWPRLSILALCYNHQSFLDDALQSIATLRYPNLEVLVADDASTDASPSILIDWKQKQPAWQFFLATQNQGNCKTFNQLLAQATGQYVLDFATDDVLVVEAIQPWIAMLEKSPEAAFCYADAWIFSADIHKKKLHSRQLKNKNFPSGHILNHLFEPAFICPPAVLFRTEALRLVAGYSENLAYEDWDVWLRLARRHPVCAYPEPVIFYRQHPGSMSASILQGNVRHLESTLQILNMVKTWPELDFGKAHRFLYYHLKISGLMQLPDLADSFYDLLKASQPTVPLGAWVFRWMAHSRLPFYSAFALWQRLKSTF